MNLEQIHSLSQKIERVLESSRVLKAENGHLRARTEELQQKLNESETQKQEATVQIAQKDEEIFDLNSKLVETERNLKATSEKMNTGVTALE